MDYAGADPGFFLGGGAPLRTGVTNTNKPHLFCRIPVVLKSRRSSQGGVRTPPPRSAPAMDSLVVSAGDLSSVRT